MPEGQSLRKPVSNQYASLRSGVAKMRTLIPLLQLLLVKMCGFLQVGELLLRELALAFVKSQRLGVQLEVFHACALLHLALEILHADLEGTFLFGLELGVGMGDVAGDVVRTRTRIVGGICDAGAALVDGAGLCIVVELDVVHLLLFLGGIGHAVEAPFVARGNAGRGFVCIVYGLQWIMFFSCANA